MSKLPAEAREEGRRVLDREDQINAQLRAYLKYRSTSSRIRIHGDYHLGQLLYTGADFIVIDFEGEPGRRLTERRAKRPALRDVAGMMRSFHYAGRMALRQQPGPPELTLALEPWVRFWVAAVSTAFLNTYLETAGNASFVPQTSDGLEIELRTFLLETALYELGYELNNRPDWVLTPLQGILDLVPAPAPREASVSG
jgi:maltose alpha-D-glucosyltransferase/alpha-amylase